MSFSKAAVLEKLNAPLKVKNLEIPHLKEGQVLVKIAYSGICQSQLNEVCGKRGEDPYLPHTLGHEGSGIVLEVGKNVNKVKEGDHVVLSWIKGSGQSIPGCTYQAVDGPVNSGAISTFQTHAVVSENRIISIPKDFPLKEAALFGCAVPTGAGIIFNTLKAEPGKSIAVFGVGGIGSSCILAAQSRGLNPIVAVDVLDSKLAFAKSIGATHIINASSLQKTESLQKIIGTRHVDYAVECAGIKNAMEKAYQCAKPQGGICVLAGNLQKDEMISINPFDLILGKRVIGTWGGESDIDQDVAHYVNLFEKNKIDLSKLISKEYSIDQINEALSDLKQGKIVRGLIKN